MKTGSILYDSHNAETKDASAENQDTLQKDDDKKTVDDIKFDPTIKLLSRIMKVILENDSIGRTALTLKANVNYTILAKHLEWLEQRSLVEFFIEDGKVNVRLTVVGIEFAFRLCGVMDDVNGDRF